MSTESTCFEVLRDYASVGKVMREAATQDQGTCPISEGVIKSLIRDALGGGSATTRSLEERIFQRLVYHLKTHPESEQEGNVAKKLDMVEPVSSGVSPVLIDTDDQLGIEADDVCYSLDVCFSSEYQSLKTHPWLKNAESFEVELSHYFDSIGLPLGRSLTHYELTLALQELLPHVNHQERQADFVAITQWAGQQHQGGDSDNVRFADYCRFLYLCICNDQADYAAKKAARNAAPVSSDGVISVGSLGILYAEGDRMKTTSPQLNRRLRLDATCSPAHETFLHAEEALRRNQVGSTWDDAIGLFERAANSAVTTRHHFVAGSAYLRCADCRGAMGDPVGQGAYLVQAGAEYRKDANYLAEAAECYLQAAECDSVAHRKSFEAKHLRAASDVLVENRDFERAVQAARKSCSIFREIKLLNDARVATWKAIECSIVNLGDLALTIELLEELSEFSEEPRQPQVLFRAMLCHLVSLPVEYSQDFSESYDEVYKSFDEYTDVCPLFLRSSEGLLIQKMLTSVLATDAEGIEEGVARYLTGHQVEEWAVDLLHRVHSNAEDKRNKAGAEKIFKIEKSREGSVNSHV